MVHANVWLGFLSAVWVSTTFAESIVRLSESRARLKVPEYTAEEKQTLADQADLMLRSLFVHRELKIADFGPTADPLPRMARIKETATSLSSNELHRSISQVFTDLHDLHTNYLAPAPLSCGLAFIPVRFVSVRDNGSNTVRVLQKLTMQAQLVEGITVGDRLLTINGQGVERVISELGRVSGGSNPDAMRSRAIQMLSFRSPVLQELPATDTLRLGFEGASRYEKEIPWMTLLDEQCLAEHEPAPAGPTSIQVKMNLAFDPFQKSFNQIFGSERSFTDGQARLNNANPFSEVFETATLQTPAGTLGYVRLKAFSWRTRSLDTGTIIEGLRRSIEGTFQEARGIVIDVRGNPGGRIALAEKLVQLFSKTAISPTVFRMLANPLNEDIFLRANGADNRWSTAVRQAITDRAPYSAPIPVTPVREANDMGQIWFRPVVVLTDSSCYSACDMFVAGLQDARAAVVVGLHQTTGGGGANVMEHRTFLEIFGDAAENPFQELPYGQNMRVAWRQTLRTGRNAGRLIENRGVRSDIVVPLSKSDIGTESRELMRQIHRIIDDRLPHHQSGIAVRRGGIVMLPNRESAKWTERIFGVDSIEIFSGTERLHRMNVTPSTTLADIELSSSSLVGEWRDQPVVILAKRQGRTEFRVVRELKWRGEFAAVPETGLRFNFDDGTLGHVKAVLLHGPADSGWRVVDRKLRVSAGPRYENSVHARSFIPLKIDGLGGRVQFEISLEAESLHDTLRMYAINPDTGEIAHYFSGSSLRAQTASLRLPLGWQRADMVFEFESDENWNLEGPVLDNFSITRMAR